MDLKVKVVIISLMSFLIIMGGIIFLCFYTISDDFSTFTGIKAITSLMTGNDVVEFIGNDNQPFLMIKPGSDTETSYELAISYLELNKGYVCTYVDSSFISCQIDAEDTEKLWIDSEMYTKYFVVFKLPKEKETTN